MKEEKLKEIREKVIDIQKSKLWCVTEGYVNQIQLITEREAKQELLEKIVSWNGSVTEKFHEVVKFLIPITETEEGITAIKYIYSLEQKAKQAKREVIEEIEKLTTNFDIPENEKEGYDRAMNEIAAKLTELKQKLQ